MEDMKIDFMELCQLNSLHIILYVLIMSRMCLRVNPHSAVV